MTDKKQLSVSEDRRAIWRASKLLPTIAPGLDDFFSKLQNAQEEWKKQLIGYEIDPKVKKAISTLVEINETITGALNAFEPVARSIMHVIEAASIKAMPLLVGLAELKDRSDILKNAGWLPHYTFPFEIIDEFKNDLEGLSNSTVSYYKSRWSEIKQTLLNNIDNYFIDLDSKETLRDAIRMHELGFFGGVPRMLFPEIERISRIDLYENKMENMASVLKLQEAAGGLTSSDVTFHGYYSLEFFGRLIEHLYVRVDETNLSKFQRDPVPNRHATIHGHVIYNSYQSSLNMLFMADYLFQVMSALRKHEQVRKSRTEASIL